MIKEIALTNGEFALVDKDDFDALSQYIWSKSGKYASSKIDGQTVTMHVFILGIRDGLEVDHKDRNGLNNTRKNLRFATHSQNVINRIKFKGESSYKGVSKVKSRNKWRAMIAADYKSYALGEFNTQEDAARAYDCAVKTLHGEFGVPNFIKSEKTISELRQKHKLESGKISRFRGVHLEKRPVGGAHTLL